MFFIPRGFWQRDRQIDIAGVLDYKSSERTPKKSSRIFLPTLQFSEQRIKGATDLELIFMLRVSQRMPVKKTFRIIINIKKVLLVSIGKETAHIVMYPANKAYLRGRWAQGTGELTHVESSRLTHYMTCKPSISSAPPQVFRMRKAGHSFLAASQDA